jgi:hypothetical protein
MPIEEQVTLGVVDIIAACCYQGQLTYDIMYQTARKLPSSPLKNYLLMYVDKQQTDVKKLIRLIKESEFRIKLNQDLKSTDIAYYGAICEFSRGAKNLEYLADIVEIGKDVENFEPIITQLKAIMLNQISNEQPTI